MTVDPNEGNLSSRPNPPKGRLQTRNWIAFAVIGALVVIALLIGSFSLTGRETAEDTARGGATATQQ